MNLTSLLSILKGGNVALGNKLENLLAEDCSILEYTDDSVLFTKGDKLVLANFTHPLTESRMSSEHIIDNVILNISLNDTTKELKTQLHSIVSNVVSEDFNSAQEGMATFCESFYSYSILKTRYSNLFQEGLKKNGKAFNFRKKAMSLVPSFKKDLFTSTAVLEGLSPIEAIDRYTTMVEKYGVIFALGRVKLTNIVTDTLLSNTVLAESAIKSLYEVAAAFPDSNDELNSMVSDGYDTEAGMSPDEDAEDVDSEDYNEDFPVEEEESVEDFAPFDPSDLSEEDKEELHRQVLIGVLKALETFVLEKAIDVNEVDIPPDLGDKIKSDLESLEDDTISAELLADIEGRWEPMISYLLETDESDPDEGFEPGVDENPLPPEVEETSPEPEMEPSAMTPPAAVPQPQPPV